MPQRDHQNTQDNSSPDPSNVVTSFDDLAKGLAGGTISRLEAVRLLGAALFSGALASVPEVALAVPPPGTEPPAGAEPSSSACERYCIRNFPAGPERAQCLSQGAQGSGPCFECNVGLSPAAGPHFPGCPPDQVFDPNAEFGTCCRTCPEDAVLCRSENGVNENCYGLDYQCSEGGTFDPSTCQCICQPGTVPCVDPNNPVRECVPSGTVC